MNNAFSISVQDLSWINGAADYPDDYCAHGHVCVQIGESSAECEATVSASALYLMKSIEHGHDSQRENQLLPCCGHTLIASADLQTCDILGCPNGVDWDVKREGEEIVLLVPDEPPVRVPLDEYREIVFRFADEVAAFYRACTPKKLPEDEWERNGWIAFQNEWRRRRGKDLYEA